MIANWLLAKVGQIWSNNLLKSPLASWKEKERKKEEKTINTHTQTHTQVHVPYKLNERVKLQKAVSISGQLTAQRTSIYLLTDMSIRPGEEREEVNFGLARSIKQKYTL